MPRNAKFVNTAAVITAMLLLASTNYIALIVEEEISSGFPGFKSPVFVG